MVQDRGGLDYRIDVSGNFQDKLRQFRSDIDRARRSFRGFKRDIEQTRVSSSGLARGAKELADSLTKLGRAQSTASKGSRSRARALTVEEAAERKLNRELRKEAVAAKELEISQARGLRVRRSTTRAISESADAQRRFTDEVRKLRVQKQVEQLRQSSTEYKKLTQQATVATRAQQRFNKQLDAARVAAAAAKLRNFSEEFQRLRQAKEPAEAVERFNRNLSRLRIEKQVRQLQSQSKEFRNLQKELKGANSRANRISFTFRRLFGILAAFTAVRVAIRGFRNLITEAIGFNARIEQATLGVASLITAVGRVSTATGEAVTGADALTAATGEARGQLEQLRLDATRTAATFDRLAETFQVALAPGLTAGLNLDEIRQFTVQISQAAAAIGLPQNQLAEEIRSLLQGTIQIRTTRIAASLGITNEQIRQAREAGVLAEFLNERFQAFSVAGEEALTTFSVILVNLQDAFRQVLGSGALEFFEQVKGLLTDIQDVLITERAGVRIVNPEAVEVINAFFDGLDISVEKARELVEELDLGDLAETAESVGRAIATAANIVRGFLSGLTEGLGAVAGVLNSLGNLGGQSRTLAEIVEFTTKWATILFSIKGVLSLLSPILSPVRGLFRLIGSATSSVLGLVGRLAASFGVTASSVGGILKSVVSIVGRFVFLNPIVRTIALVFTGLVAGAKQLVKSILGVELSLKDSVKLIAVALKGQFQELAIEARILAQELKDVFTFSDTAEQEISDTIDALLLEKLGLQKKLKQEFSDILDAAALEGDIAGALGEGFDKASEDTTLEPSVSEEAVGAVEEIVALYSDLPAIISESTRAFELQGSQVKQLEDDAREAARAVREAFAVEGLGSAVAGQQQAVLEARNRIEDDGRQLAAKRLEAEQQLVRVQQEQVRFAQRLNQEGQIASGFVAADTTAAQEVIDLQQQLSTTQTDIRLAELELREARARGDEDAAQGVQERLAGLRTEEQALSDATDVRRELAEQLREGLSQALGEEQAQRLIELSEEGIVLLGQQEVIQGNLNDLGENQASLEERINEIRDARLRASAVEATAQFQRRAGALQDELNLQLRLNQIEQNRATRNFESQRAQIEARIAALTREQQISAQTAQAEIAAQTAVISGTDDLTTKLTLEQQLAAQINQATIEQRLFAAEIDGAKQKLEELNAIAERPISFGAQRALEEFTFTAEEQFQETFDIISTTLDGFVAEASQQIVDAFDPTVKQEDINARVARFLQGLANQILQFLVRLALSKVVQSLTNSDENGQGQTRAAAALTTAAASFAPVIAGLNGSAANLQAAAASLAAANATSTSVGGAAAGGLIGKGKVRFGAAHFASRGYSSGGGIGLGGRPRGLDPRDTQPIWAQPGEWMMQVRAVRKYGATVMQRINQGMVNPAALSALTGAASVTVRRPSGPGFQSGGLISKTRNTALDLNAPATPTTSGGRVLVASRRQHERILAQGGMDATMEGLDERSAELNVLLSKNRG